MILKPDNMDLTLLKRKAAVFAACISVFSALSCVQEEYEVSEENINMEVTVFQDGVTLPLGNTKAITLGEILGSMLLKSPRMRLTSCFLKFKKV